MAKYTIEQLRLLYFLSNNMDEDEFEECYGNVNFSRLEKLMAETSPVFETEVIDPDFEVEPDEPAELKYEIENVYEGMSMEQLVQFFKDKETFYNRVRNNRKQGQKW